MQHHLHIRLGHRTPRWIFEASVHGHNIPSSSENITKKDLTATICTAVCSERVNTTIYQELSASVMTMPFHILILIIAITLKRKIRTLKLKVMKKLNSK